MNKVLGLIILLFLGICDIPCVAQSDKADSMRMFSLNPVEIVASRDKEVIAPQRLSGVELERLNSLSVADAIRYFSGVQIKDYGGIGGLKTVDIRSMGTNHMGVFYDGIQLGNAQNGQIDLGKFSLDNIEEISLYNGQKSEIFQPAKDFGSAGTIYLKTRKPTFKNSTQTNLRFLFRTGSFDLINPSVLWEQKLSSTISSSFNAEYIHSSGKYKFRYKTLNPDGTVAWDTTAIRQNGDIQALRLEGGLTGSISKGYWNVKGYFYDSEKGIPGAIVNNIWKHSQRQWDRNFFAQGSLYREITKKYELLANVKYAHDGMRYLNPDTTSMYIDNTFGQQEIYASIANKYSILSNWDISLSTDFQWNVLDADLRDFIEPKRYTGLIALATVYEIHRVKMQASLLTTLVHEKSIRKSIHNPADDVPLLNSVQRGDAPDKAEYTPAVFVSYQPLRRHDFSLRAFYKKIFRMPTFNDLYYTDIGNISLRPEYTQQFDFGVQYKKVFKESLFNTFGLRADVYYNEVTDKIIAVPNGSKQYRWMMMNIGFVEIRGVDVSGNTAFGIGEFDFNVNVSYTHQKAQDFTDPADTVPPAGTFGGQIAYIPKHNGSVIFGTTYKTWDFNYSLIYVGERYHNSSNIRENYEPSWYTSDVSIGKVFRWKRTALKLTAEINNLFDQAYDVVLNYPMPGRNYKLILRLDI